jgi:hypothetical protein
VPSKIHSLNSAFLTVFFLAAATPYASADKNTIKGGRGNVIQDQHNRTTIQNNLVGNNIGEPFPTVGDTCQYDQGGMLIGAACVIDALGRYMVNAQEANLLKERVRQAQLENRRREFYWWLERRENTPTRQDELEREAREDLRYSRFAPTKAAIWSGRALNVILEDLKRAESSKLSGAQQTIEAHVLQRINLTDGRNAANFGILKNEAQLVWPAALRSEQLGADGTELRQRAQTLLTQLFTDARAQRSVDSGTAKEIDTCIRRLDGLLRQRVNALGFSEYVESKTYLRQLNDSLVALQKSNAADYLSGKYSLKNLKENTVAEVIKYLRDNGLEFAPACDGDFEAYIALHRMLANCNPGPPVSRSEEKK